MTVKGTTDERGYDARHQAERKRHAPTVKAGHATCARCSRPIDPDEPWDLGHTDDRTAWTGPEHRACNRSAGGKNAAAVTNARRAMTIREW